MSHSSLFFEPILLIAFLLAYFLGSIPFGLILTKISGKGDIRNIGSGNIGTTNVLRTGSKKLAALTLLGDLLKGTISVLCAKYLFFKAAFPPENIYNIYLPMVAIFAILGHIFPVWLKFKGGKGVATYIGVLFGFLWPMAIFFLLFWIATAYLTKYSSLSALIAALLVPLFSYIFYNGYIALFLSFISLLLFIKHKENLKRLLRGEESKISFLKK